MAFVSSSSANYPLYLPRKIFTTIAGSTLGSAQNYISAKGFVTLAVIDSTTGYTFSFSLMGGYDNNTATLPTANSILFAIPDTALGCTVVNSSYTTNNNTKTLVTTPAGDSGGRQYEFTNYMYPSVKPTIRLVSGNAVATTLIVQSMDQVSAGM